MIYPNSSKVHTTEGINIKERSSSALAIKSSINVPTGQNKNIIGNNLRESHNLSNQNNHDYKNKILVKN